MLLKAQLAIFNACLQNFFTPLAEIHQSMVLFFHLTNPFITISSQSKKFTPKTHFLKNQRNY